MTEEQLLSHAARCATLADVCLDRVVARKLRALAQDYRSFAKRYPDRLTAYLSECPPLLAVTQENKSETAAPAK